MIRVNLLPGGKKRKAGGGGLPFKLPSFGGGGDFTDPWMLATILVPILGIAAAAWMYTSVTSEHEEVQVALEEARQDSIRFADIREKTDLLTARADSVTQKVTIIQEIDEGRYVWPHILDEVARALPDYTWLASITQITGDTEPIFSITGNAGNPFALTVFMDQLEASPFIRNVQLQQTTQVQDQRSGQIVYEFELEAEYEQPPLEFLETVPLFGGGASEAEETADTTMTDAAADTASGTP